MAVGDEPVKSDRGAPASLVCKSLAHCFDGCSGDKQQSDDERVWPQIRSGASPGGQRVES